MKPEDAVAICDIYNEHVRNTTVTFELDVVDEAGMRDRIFCVGQNYPWIVMEINGILIGYAYATAWRERVAYRQTVETAIYIREDAHGNGHGRKLYQALLDRLRQSQEDFHVALGAIALPNPASTALHESLGFKKVAEFPEVGRKFDRWIDVGFWQLAL